jgi:hypothetical protein
VEGICTSGEPTPGCTPCATAEECDDEDVCTADTCTAEGVCQNVPQKGCVPCEGDLDCNDGNACTSDTCGEDGSCQFNTIPGCVPCEVDEECDDEDECTEDSCFQGACANVEIPGCGVCTPTAEVCGDGEDNDCDELIDCDDPNCAESPQCEGPVEICGDCIDNDGDTFVDLDDPDCCALSQSIPMRFLRIKTKATVGRRRLHVNSRFRPAVPVENFDPLTQETTFQLSDETGKVYCANLPVDKWRKRGTPRTIYRYKDKKNVLEGGLHHAAFREKRKGQVIFRGRGGKVDLSVRDFRGDVRTTIRLGDECSVAAGELREGRKGNQIRFP